MRRLTSICSLAALLLVADLAAAAVPMHIPLQGALRDNAGAPVSEGTFEMTFTLYRDAEGTDSAWTTTRTVDVHGGLFRAMLGEEAPVDPALFSAPGSLWLGVQVEAEPELPLRPLASTPYALAAGDAAGLSCSGCVAPEAFSPEALQVIRDEAVIAGAAAGFAVDAAGLAYDDSVAAIGATSVQGALEELKVLVEAAASAGGGNVNEGAGSISRISNQWGLPSYGTAVEYIHLMNPSPPKVLLHLYGGENTGFASSNNLIVSNSYTPNTYSGQANGSAGDDTLTVANAGAFNQGDHILIHQSAGTDTGYWELNAVQAINGNSLKLAKPLESSYVSNDGSTAQRAQVVIAASYNTFEVVNGGSVYPSDSLSNGTSSNFYGGIVYIRARQLTVKNGGSVHADHRGYYSGGWNSWYNASNAGNSECNTGDLYQDNNNCSGGGGGWPHTNGGDCNTGGGGGGNKTAGTDGANGGCYTTGKGGLTKGAVDGSQFHFGGAGGQSYPHGGGRGGGIVVLGADTLIVESGGRISANGEPGQPNPGDSAHGGVGGGAGGTVAIFANNIDVQGTVEAAGGAGGRGCYGNGNCTGGQGGEGWVFQQQPVPGIVNQSYATGVEIWVDDQEVTPIVGDPNGKGQPHWSESEAAWGGTGTAAWSSGPLDLTSAADWTLGEHKIEFKETGGAGGDLKAYLYLIQTFTESTPPVNDTCTTPVTIDLSEGPVVVSGTTEDVMGKTKATDANSAECGGAGGSDVTYRIDLDQRSLIHVASVSPFPLRLYLRAEDCTDGELVYCAIDDFSTTPLEPGTYFLIADSDDAQAKGDFNLAVSLTPATLPDNDTCETAMALIFSPAGVATDAGTTLYGLDQYESFCGGGAGADGVYKFTAGTGQIIDIAVDSTDFTPILYLYKDACGDGAPVFCDVGSAIATPPQAGGEYWLVVDSGGEAQWGAYDLTVSLITPAP